MMQVASVIKQIEVYLTFGKKEELLAMYMQQNVAGVKCHVSVGCTLLY
jgi:hypothetical protein